MLGLTRALMYAGSPRILCSLWQVDDQATKALMVRFYELWNPKEGEGKPAAAALRQAQEFVRSQEKWNHPFYWAAWVLSCLPDRPIVRGRPSEGCLHPGSLYPLQGISP